jgi:soluble lytic murein transglycosylase-like protein
MDNSFFTSRVQSILSQMLLKMLENTSEPEEAPKPTWVQPGPVGGSASLPGADRLQAASASAQTAGKTSRGVSSDFESLIQKASEQYGVDAGLIRSVIRAESNFNPKATSKAGAQGLMQLMPATAAGLGVENPYDPKQNVDGGVRLLRQLLKRYDGDVSLALAAYNAGPGAVDRYGGIPPYRETQTYVSRVLGYLESKNQWSK